MSKTAGAQGLEYFIMRLRKLTTGSPLLQGSRLAGQVIFLILVGTFGHSACGNSATEARSVTPWERQYKIKPSEKARLTAADVLGPDGIVYPNWTKCGVQSGIPKTKAVASIEDFGAKADDDADDSEALTKACEAAGKMGGGAVLLGEGTYYLDRPVTIRHDNVVVRGKGPDRTRLIFRYSIGSRKAGALPENSVVFYNPRACLGLAEPRRAGSQKVFCRCVILMTSRAGSR